MDLCNGQVLKFLAAVFFLGVAFSQDYDYPTYSENNLPETSFSCEDKSVGGYYADIETDCQMYHVCAKDKHGSMKSTKFLCGNGTVFDQRHLVCQDYRRVQRCSESPKYYRNAASILALLEVFGYPTYSRYRMPQTSFTCEDKDNGGYYADVETDCQMYHVCSIDKNGYLRSTKFLCGKGTVFDQRDLVCQNHGNVQRCKDSALYYKDAVRNRGNWEDYDYPTYPEVYLPETSFSCEGKSNGGYYADIETDCKMYHVCSKDQHGFMKSTKFLCGNDTVFDQRHLVCDDYEKVPNCKDSEKYYKRRAVFW